MRISTVTELSPLEQRIVTAEKYGKEWADKYEKWLQIDESKKNYLASLMNDLDKGDLSEAKLERLARGSDAFKQFITNLCIAKGEELRAKVRYENARDYFEAGRSREATERQKMATLGHIP
jgi:hypothetical protein